MLAIAMTSPFSNQEEEEWKPLPAATWLVEEVKEAEREQKNYSYTQSQGSTR